MYAQLETLIDLTSATLLFNISYEQVQLSFDVSYKSTYKAEEEQIDILHLL